MNRLIPSTRTSIDDVRDSSPRWGMALASLSTLTASAGRPRRSASVAQCCTPVSGATGPSGTGSVVVVDSVVVATVTSAATSATSVTGSVAPPSDATTAPTPSTTTATTATAIAPHGRSFEPARVGRTTRRSGSGSPVPSVSPRSTPASVSQTPSRPGLSGRQPTFRAPRALRSATRAAAPPSRRPRERPDPPPRPPERSRDVPSTVTHRPRPCRPGPCVPAPR